MSIKTPKRLALGVIAALVFAPFASIAPASATDIAYTVASASAATTTTGTAVSVPVTFGTIAADIDAACAITLTPTTQTGAGIGNATFSNTTLTATNGWTVTATGTGALTMTAAGTFAAATKVLTDGKIVGSFNFTPTSAGVYTVTTTLSSAGAGCTTPPTPATSTFTLTVGTNSALAALVGDGGAPTLNNAVVGVAGPANFISAELIIPTTVSTTINRLVVADAGLTFLTATTANAAGGTNTNTTTISSGKNSVEVIAVQDGTAKTAHGRTALQIATPTVGTYTVKVYSLVTAGIYSSTASETITVTVNAAAVTNVYSAGKSTVHVATGNNTPDATSDAAVATTPIAVSRTLNTTTPVARILVTQKDANGTNLSSGFKSVSASIAGAGLLGTANNAASGASVTPTAAATNGIWVYANGTGGVGTVTVSVDGVVVKTVPVSFYGAVSSLTATSKISSINADAGTNVAGVFEVEAKDVNGLKVPNVSLVLDKVADPTLVTAITPVGDGDGDAKQLVGIQPVALKYGTTTVTVKSGTVISNPVTVVFAHNQIATATLALDAATYLPGVKGKLTMAAKDKNDLIVPDALTNVATLAFSSNLSTTSTFGTQPAFVAGAYAQDVFAPALTNLTDWTISVKITANAIFATTLVPAAGATLTATAKVGIPPVVVPVVVPPVVYDNPTLSFVKDGGRIILSGTAVDGEGDIIIYTKRVGTTAWKERAKTLEVAAPGDFNGSIKALKNNVVIRVKQEGTGQFSNQIIVLK